MIAGRKKRRALRIAALMAAAAPVVALVTACSAPGGTAAARDAAPAHAAARTATSAAAGAGQAPAADVRAAVSAVTATRAARSSAGPAARAAARPAKAPDSPAAASPSGAPARAAAAAGAHRVTFVNRVTQTIWVAAAQNPAHPLTRTGWTLKPGHSLTITVPAHWNGRFWGRTGCVFRDGRGHCQSGDCGGRYQCTGNGAIPATLAEYDMNAWDGLDFYDVSMVDGSNLPMFINVTHGTAANRVSRKGCVAAGCTTAVNCPSVLRVKAAGSVVGCESACARFGTDQYCCRAQWAPRAACNPARWPVDYAAVFKRAEPYAYSYADDDATSTFVCKGRCDYRITFGLTPPG
jgi:Thaumatin family